jgi:hypothetical protein
MDHYLTLALCCHIKLMKTKIFCKFILELNCKCAPNQLIDDLSNCDGSNLVNLFPPNKLSNCDVIDKHDVDGENDQKQCAHILQKLS